MNQLEYDADCLKVSSSIQIANKVLKFVIQYCALHVNHVEQNTKHCERCAQAHLPKLVKSIENNEPISFVLPAFPGKSPNLAKVTGVWPDKAERSSLSFLNDLCHAIKEIYSPGAHIIICSDGRVFSDIIGMKDEHITTYQKEINTIIDKFNLQNLSTFNLDELQREQTFDGMREELLLKFGKPLQSLKNMVSRGASEQAMQSDREANRMYRGITKFLFEDAMHPGQTKSKTKVQNEARTKAYLVIQRSNAWSELISQQFPDHVRLSIHPQTCGDVKLGIKLLSGKTTMTPWHGVVLDQEGEITFVKRHEAERLGAELIYDENGRADHYKLRIKKS